MSTGRGDASIPNERSRSVAHVVECHWAKFRQLGFRHLEASACRIRDLVALVGPEGEVVTLRMYVERCKNRARNSSSKLGGTPVRVASSPVVPKYDLETADGPAKPFEC